MPPPDAEANSTHVMEPGGKANLNRSSLREILFHSGSLTHKANGIKNVVVIEKLAVMGGNSCIAVGDICAVDSPITRKAKIKDSVDLFVSDFNKAGGGYNHKDISRTVGEWFGKAIEFLISDGCQFSSDLMKHFRHSAARIHHPIGGCANGVLKPLRKAFLEKYQGEIRIRTKMDEIIKDHCCPRTAKIECT